MSLLALTSPASAGDERSPHITVFGTATTEVTPNQMVWFITVRNRGSALDKVAEEHSKVVEDVLDMLKKTGVDGGTIQTARMEFGENGGYKSSWDSIRSRDEYSASTAVSFKITNLDLYKKLWLALSKNPAVNLTSIGFDHTQRIQFQNETRQKAILAAKEKAAGMAKAAGVELGEPWFIEEELVNDYPWGGSYLNSVSSDGGKGQFQGGAAGTIPIQMRVRMEFRLK